MGRQALAVVMFACIGGFATASYFGYVPVSDASAWLAEGDFVSWSRGSLGKFIPFPLDGHGQLC